MSTLWTSSWWWPFIHITFVLPLLTCLTIIKPASSKISACLLIPPHRLQKPTVLLSLTWQPHPWQAVCTFLWFETKPLLQWGNSTETTVCSYWRTTTTRFSSWFVLQYLILDFSHHQSPHYHRAISQPIKASFNPVYKAALQTCANLFPWLPAWKHQQRVPLT